MKNRSFISRLGFALNGLQSALKNEASLKFQVTAAIGVFLVLGMLRASPVWWALISLTVGAVLTAEVFNTALEHALDRLHPEFHESIRLAKDCAAGAVLIASLASIFVFVAFLVDKF